MSKKPAQRNGTSVEEFDPHRVRPLPGQPRKRFRGIDELAASMKEIGQLSNGLVERITTDKRFDAQLIDGERRLRACQKAGIPFRAEIRAKGDNAEDAFAASFAANFCKQDHDVLEIAEGLLRLQASGKSVEQMCRIAGKSDCWVYQHLSLNQLHDSVRAMLVPKSDDESASLSFSIAQLLVPLDKDSQLRVANEIIKKELSMAGARRLILKRRRAAGDEMAGAGPKDKYRSFRTLKSIAATVEDRAGVYLDMPRALLDSLIDGASVRDKEAVAQALDSAADNLASLAQEIRDRVDKKPPLRKAG